MIEGLHKPTTRKILMMLPTKCSKCGRIININEYALETVVEGAYYRMYMTDYYHMRCYDKNEKSKV